MQRMRIVSRVVAILGAIALLAGLFFLVPALFEIWKQWVAISANRSRDFINPIPNALIGSSIAVLGAFVLGLGIGLPKGRRREAVPPGDQPTSITTTEPVPRTDPDVR